MNRLVPRVLAFVALLAVLGVTLSALRDSSHWRSSGRGLKPMADEPFRALASMLAPGHDTTATATRNPFAYAEVHVASAPRHPVATPKPVEVAKPDPVLTAIIIETGNADPKAVISYEGRSYTVGPGDLFADWRVISVTPDEVKIENTQTGRQLVLKVPKKGD